KVRVTFLEPGILGVLELALFLQQCPSSLLLATWTCRSRSPHQVSALFFVDDFETLSTAEDCLEDHGPDLRGPNYDPLYKGELFPVLGTDLSQCPLFGEAAESSEYSTGVLRVFGVLHSHLGCGS